MKLIPVIALALLVGCGPGREEARQMKLEQLSALRKEQHANLIRARSDCQAVGVEFGGKIMQTCLEGLRIQAEIAQKILSDIDKRQEEIEEGR